MNYLTARGVASAMGGKVSPSNPNIVRCPGPGHSKHDDSLAVIISDTDPEGFYTHSHSGDDWRDCRDLVRGKLGLPDRPLNGHARYTPPAPKPKGERTGPKRTVAEYVYRDKDGNDYHKVIRQEWEGGAKTFLQKHMDIETWENGDGGLPPIPYNLPDIIARHDEPIWLVEGEKNAEDLTRLGFLATTAKGGASAFPRTPGFAQWFDGSTVYVIPDNDEPGRKWLDAVREIIPHAQVVTLPDLPEKGDVSDWIAAGGTAQKLVALATAPQPAPRPTTITPTPFVWADPSDIAPREWLYDAHLIRKFVSLTVSPGGLGKSSLALVEALSMATGRALFKDAKVHEPEPLRVWYWNGEDPQEETQRRVVAAAKHYELTPNDFASRLFTDTGREQALVLGQIIRGEIELDDDLFDDIEAAMITNRIDVLMLDPFVSAHRLGENDNNAIDAVIKRLGKLADRTNAAIEIVHHVRKPSTADVETDVNDARGASALLGGVRSARVLNVMPKSIASDAMIPEDMRLRHFSVTNGKANMSAKSASAQWRFLESVCLDNQRGHRLSDNVGVVTYYKLPEVAQERIDLSGAEDAMRIILSQDDTVRHFSGKGPKPNNWIVHRILEALNIHDPTKEPAVQKLVLGWLRDEIITLRSLKIGTNRVPVLTLKEAPFVASDPDDTPF